MSVNTAARLRLGIELAFLLISVALLLATLVRPDWIELLIGIEPDGGSGTLEVAMTLAAAIATLAFAGLAALEWRGRPSPAG